MHWEGFAQEQPRLADLGRRRISAPGLALVATIRSDGTPRVSPVEPLLWESDLWLSMLQHSRKAADLERDARVLVHSIVTERDGRLGEFKVRGEAIAERDRHVQRGFSEAVRMRLGWQPEPGKFHLFRIDVQDVTFLRYDDSTGDQFTTRWPAGGEYVRRGTSATTVGPPEWYAELLE